MKAVLLSVLTSALVVLSALSVAFQVRDSTKDATGGASSPVQWWFDADRGTLCWIGKRDSYGGFDIIVDLDRNHDTGFSSVYSATGPFSNYTAPTTWSRFNANGTGGGNELWNETRTGPSRLSEVAVYPPLTHYRFEQYYGGPWSEWFHPFVTKRTPPTDWVLGWSSDDGNRSLPITKPFWVSFSFGGAWTEYDPAHFTGPTGVCKEDLPPVQTLKASVDFDPDTLNPRSQGKWITVYIELPQGYDPRDINATTVRLNNTLTPVLDPKYGFVTDPAGYITDHDHDGIMERMVKFDRAAAIALLKPGTYPIRITGMLASGMQFEGLSEPIRIMDASR